MVWNDDNMFLPKYALYNKVNEVDILHLKLLFSTEGKEGEKKTAAFFYLSLTCFQVLLKNIASSTVWRLFSGE